ncbi:hypothetical protein BVRB_4g084070 [Beta vulgaris subsp. vulgaris]|nr:hypothetical protein BVRB_4g084070 [Beta vulgaris subsp. vulgaris]
MMGSPHTLSIKQVSEAFGFPRGGLIGPHNSYSRQFNSGHFWRLLTSLFTYDPRPSKAAGIINPGFRYVHRLLASILFARGDSSGVVSLRELYFLWHMTQGDCRLVPSMWLMDHLDDVRKGNGEITIGGLISIFAICLGYDLSNLAVVPGETRLNLCSLRAMHWITETDNASEYVWLVSQRPYAYLPNPEATVIYLPENWIFQPDFEWQPAADSSGDPMDEDPGAATQTVPDVPSSSSSSVEQQLASLQSGFGDLRLEVQSFRYDVQNFAQSNHALDAHVQSLQGSYATMVSEFQGFRSDFQSWTHQAGCPPGSSALYLVLPKGIVKLC